MSLSHIQNQILHQLLSTEQARYSEIMPENIDQNLFNYHLKYLLEHDFVVKDEESKLYSLSNSGKKYIQKFDALGIEQQYFRFSVIAYLLRDTEKAGVEILTHRRKRHPYLGDFGGISGKVKYGEKVEDAASRKLLEETGLTCTDFKLIGVHRKMRYDKDDKLIEDTLYHCLISREFSGELITENNFGKNEWKGLHELIELDSKNITASSTTRKIYALFAKPANELFYFQEELKLSTF